MSNTRSTRQEKKTADDLGGRREIASGALPGGLADCRTPNFLAEMKYTDAKGYRLDRAYLKRLTKNAHLIGKNPVLVVEFCGEEAYAVIRYQELLDYDRLITKESDDLKETL
jgi:hypothetical protein